VYARHLLTVVLAAGLAGCSSAGLVAAARTPAASLVAMATDETLSAADKMTLMQALESLAPDFTEGESVPGKPVDIGPKGSLLYRAFGGSLLLRKAGYKLAEGPVLRHFSKPGVADQVPALSAAERTELLALLQPGDVIQCGNDASFVHAAYYEGNGIIVHALAQSGFGKKMIGVRREPLAENLERVERDKVVVLRAAWTPEKLDAAEAYAKAQVGKDYDVLFLTDVDDRHYCTELIFAILTRTGAAKVEPHLASKAKWRLITNDDLRKSPDMDVVWRRNHD
jgi:hypothetical protein